MKNLNLILALIILNACTHYSTQDEPIASVTVEHPYQTDSIIERPRIFFPDLVSTSIDKFNTSFSPDGKTIYYTATSQKLGLTGIAFQKFDNGSFQTPEFVPFVSHDIPIADVQISPDGKYLLYSTFKDYEGKKEGFHFDLWRSENVNGQWQTPQPMDSLLNSAGNEFYPVMTDGGTLYFNSDASGNSDLYFSRYENGAYQPPIRLPDIINTPEREADAFIARDESYIIFVRVDQPDGLGNSDLYISFRTGDNQWTAPKHMGERVNSPQIDGSPYVTPDGKYLFFTSGRLTEGIKEKAMSSYQAFQSTLSSHQNGSLNFYYLSFDPEDFR